MSGWQIISRSTPKPKSHPLHNYLLPVSLSLFCPLSLPSHTLFAFYGAQSYTPSNNSIIAYCSPSIRLIILSSRFYHSHESHSYAPCFAQFIPISNTSLFWLGSEPEHTVRSKKTFKEPRENKRFKKVLL